jgi:hypothetical protein
MTRTGDRRNRSSTRGSRTERIAMLAGRFYARALLTLLTSCLVAAFPHRAFAQETPGQPGPREQAAFNGLAQAPRRIFSSGRRRRAFPSKFRRDESN